MKNQKPKKLTIGVFSQGKKLKMAIKNPEQTFGELKNAILIKLKKKFDQDLKSDEYKMVDQESFEYDSDDEAMDFLNLDDTIRIISKTAPKKEEKLKQGVINPIQPIIPIQIKPVKQVKQNLINPIKPVISSFHTQNQGKNLYQQYKQQFQQNVQSQTQNLQNQNKIQINLPNQQNQQMDFIQNQPHQYKMTQQIDVDYYGNQNINPAKQQARIIKELKMFSKCNPRIKVFPNDNDYNLWSVLMIGPPGSPYNAGVFVMAVEFGKDYPKNAPQVNFITNIYHINCMGGQICIPVLQEFMVWNEKITMVDIFKDIDKVLLHPEMSFPLDSNQGKFYETLPADYNKKALILTQKNANENINDMMNYCLQFSNISGEEEFIEKAKDVESWIKKFKDIKYA